MLGLGGLLRSLATGLSFAALALSSAAGTPPSVVRGPYLQLATPTSVVVRWRTDVATDSQVRFGAEPTSLEGVREDLAPTTEHQVVLDSLVPESTYFYAVGTTTATLAGGDAEHTFKTPPTAGTARPTRIWVLGDSGTANVNAMAVRDAFETFSAGRPPDFWMMLGDNAYPDGADARYQEAVFDLYPRQLRTSVLWPAFGNHDAVTADSATQTGPYYEVFTLPTAAEAGGVASGTEAYYSFDHGNLHFVCLDSQESDRSPGSPMLTWLETDLLATQAEWIVAFWHHPPYTKGSHDSDLEAQLVDMRQNVLPILEGLGVDLVLTGHSHAFERSFLLDGHYGTSDTLAPSMILDGGDGRPTGDGAYRKPSLAPTPHEGAVYVVAGSSGQTSGGSLDHPAMFVALDRLGSLVIDVDGGVLVARFLDADGSVGDAFRIVKADSDALFADGFESGDLSAWSSFVP